MTDTPGVAQPDEETTTDVPDAPETTEPDVGPDAPEQPQREDEPQ